MKTKMILAALMVSMSLFSCTPKQYRVSDYEKNLDYTKDFKIMQLTDLHFGIQTDPLRQEKYLTSLINEANPDLIVFTGDSFMNATVNIVNRLITFIDSFDIKFAFTYGNHELQGYYDHFFINDQLMGAKNSVFIDYIDDSLKGHANYYINLNKDDKPLYRLLILDSNSYYYNIDEYDYDVIREEQIKHYEEINSDMVPNLLFTHIPFHEYRDAYQGALEGIYPMNPGGINEEGVSAPYKNNNEFARFKAINTKGVFVGHDHTNYSDILYEDVILSFGVKSTDLIYHNKTGYKLITLPENPADFGLKNIESRFKDYE